MQRPPVADATFQRAPDAILRRRVGIAHLQVPQECNCLHVTRDVAAIECSTNRNHPPAEIPLLKAFFNSPRVHWTWNALASVPKSQHAVVAAAFRQAFTQPDQKGAQQVWRHAADQLRHLWPKLATLMDESGIFRRLLRDVEARIARIEDLAAPPPAPPALPCAATNRKRAQVDMRPSRPAPRLAHAEIKVIYSRILLRFHRPSCGAPGQWPRARSRG